MIRTGINELAKRNICLDKEEKRQRDRGNPLLILSNNLHISMNEQIFSWAHGSQENKYKGVRNK